MTLQSFQSALKALYMAAETYDAIESPEALHEFIHASDLTDAEKESILKQPQPRLKQYRFMLYANQREALSEIFPYTKLCMGAQWDQLVSQYFYAVQPKSYILLDTGKTFITFLAEHEALLKGRPYIANLAAFEWSEMELLNAPNATYSKEMTSSYPTDIEQLQNTAPIINAVSQLLTLDYNVIHVIDTLDSMEDKTAPLPQFGPQQTFLWVYRNPVAPFQCRFFVLNMILAAFLSTATDHQEDTPTWSYAQILQTVLDALGQNISFEDATQGLLPILAQLHGVGILLGSYAVK